MKCFFLTSIDNDGTKLGFDREFSWTNFFDICDGVPLTH